jgi:hypothetical protein
MAKVPAELFVVSKINIEREYTTPGNWSVFNEIEHNFGFLHPHAPNLAAGAKRQRTQMQWAYSNAYEKNGEWWEKGTHYQFDQFTRKYDAISYDRKIADEVAPRIWENVPTTGFKIIDTVNRYRGNKLFKVLDPRGIEFEITVQSLFHLLQEGTVSNGIIQDPCVWMKNKDLVVARSVLQ